MIAKKQPPLVESFIQRLGAGGLRATGARRAVARAVARQRGHFAAEAVAQEASVIGRATVFRTIKLLVEMGFVCRVLLEDGRMHYQISHRGHHHHLICTECGLSQDLLGCDLDSILRERAADRQFTMEGHWLEVYGRCGRCLHRKAA
ncbi:MAG: transcriptional repressor [Dehalococcoidia bacterium]